MQIMRINKKYLLWFLSPLALFYWGIVHWRNLFYNLGFFVSKRLPCKVISIGNLTVGGTGKTPMVILLASLIKQYGGKVAILSRGYGRKTKGTLLVSDGKSDPTLNYKDCGDEPYLLANILKGIPIVVDEDRFRGGMFITKKFNPQVIILDDGFQHRALERDLDIVLVNASDNIMEHKLMPYGILREPWGNIVRADAVILTKTNLQNPKPFLMKKLKNLNMVFFNSKMYSVFSPLQNFPKPRSLKNKKIFVFSGIGDPASFILSLKNLGATICGIKKFVDHHKYKQKDLLVINQKGMDENIDYLVTTEKDWVKIKDFQSKHPIIVFGAQIKISNKKNLIQLLQPIIN